MIERCDGVIAAGNASRDAIRASYPGLDPALISVLRPPYRFEAQPAYPNPNPNPNPDCNPVPSPGPGPSPSPNPNPNLNPNTNTNTNPNPNPTLKQAAGPAEASGCAPAPCVSGAGWRPPCWRRG